MTLPTYAVTGKRIWIVKLNLRGAIRPSFTRTIRLLRSSTRLPSFTHIDVGV
jgi:hypothetical protein